MIRQGESVAIYNGIRVYLHKTTRKAYIEPAWYDFPRRLGWREKKFEWVPDDTVPKGQAFKIDKPSFGGGPVLIIRDDDWPDFSRAIDA